MPESPEEPQVQIAHWLKQYCEHVNAPEVARSLDNATVFRIARTMFQQGKTLDDVQQILIDLAKQKRKPRGVGWIITVIEGQLGKVA